MDPLALNLLIFLAFGAGFVLVNLLVGKVFRPRRPETEKGTIYECGEPTIGSAWVQFDLRYYVIALLFVIFDVEVAFFFPWAEVFGKATAVSQVSPPKTPQQYRELADRSADLARVTLPDFSEDAFTNMRTRAEMSARVEELNARLQQPNDPANKEEEQKRAEVRAELSRLQADLYAGEGQARDMINSGRSIAWLAFLEILVFFGVLLVGFAYLWKRGDLAWVRSLSDRQTSPAAPPAGPAVRAGQPAVPVGAKEIV
jgi:NADH-quinone oxidoreductase subunit A